MHTYFEYDGITYDFRGKVGMPFMNKIKSTKTFYESQFLEYIKSLNLHGAYIDCGCFVGNHTVFFANHCTSTEVFAIDADIHFYEFWEHNTKKNITNNGKVFYLNYALMDKPGFVALNPYKLDDPLTCTDIKGKDVTDNGEIEAITLDALMLGLLGDTPIAFIKLDIEGCELKALHGAKNIIQKYHPVIATEAWKKHEQDNITKYLEQFGYRLLKQFNIGAPMLVFKYSNVS